MHNVQIVYYPLQKKKIPPKLNAPKVSQLNQTHECMKNQTLFLLILDYCRY
jgi:hypothetical protein